MTDRKVSLETDTRRVKHILKRKFDENLKIVLSGIENNIIGYDEKSNSVHLIPQKHDDSETDDESLDLRGGSMLDSSDPSSVWMLLAAVYSIGIAIVYNHPYYNPSFRGRRENDEYDEPSSPVVIPAPPRGAENDHRYGGPYY